MKTNERLTGYAFLDTWAGGTEFWGHPGTSLAGTGNRKLHHTNSKTFHTFKGKVEKPSADGQYDMLHSVIWMPSCLFTHLLVLQIHFDSEILG